VRRPRAASAATLEVFILRACQAGRRCARPDRPGPVRYGPAVGACFGSWFIRFDRTLELLDRLAALVPPPRVHRHRHFGVLAPNSPLRAAVTALALAAVTAPPAPSPEPPATEPAHRHAARCA